jgi:hypothetical protein
MGGARHRAASALRLAALALGGAVFAGALSACGGSSRASSGSRPDAGRVTDAGGESDAPSGGVCGSSPKLLLNYVPYVPDAGREAVQVPGIFVGGANIYFVLNWNTPIGSAVPPGGLLMRVPTRGGSAVKMASIPGGGSPAGQELAVTSKAVVFIETLNNKSGDGALASIPRDGGDVTVLATTAGLANAVVADDQNAYFVDDEGVKSVPLAGGKVRLLTSAKPFSFQLIGSTLYLAELAEGSAGQVASLPAAGGPVTVLASGLLGPFFPTACGADLCWMSEVSFLEARLEQLAPGQAPVVLADSGDLAEPLAMVFDGENFFVAAGAGGQLLVRVPSGAGAPTIVEARGGMSGLAMDPDCLYWSCADGIFSLARSVADGEPGGDE